MDKDSDEYKKLKKEMDDYLLEKENAKERNHLSALGFSRGTYPSKEHQRILKKRYKKVNHESVFRRISKLFKHK